MAKRPRPTTVQIRPAPTTTADLVTVRTKSSRLHWRAGLLFGPTPRAIDLVQLSYDERSRLHADTDLIIEPAV